MQKKYIFSYFFILVTLLVIMSLSRSTSEKMRGEAVAIVSPLWENLGSKKVDAKLPMKEEIHRLQLENQLLSNELSYLLSLFDYQENIQSKASHFQIDIAEEAKLAIPKLTQNVKMQVEALPARVVMRSYDTWNSFLWIDVGSDSNYKKNRAIIAKDSPVLVGNAVVGVIDYVDKKQSRVRLITDEGLNPSVRASRGGEQEIAMGEQIDNVINWIKRKKLTQLSIEDKYKLLSLLTTLKATLQPFKKSYYLAKGELRGSSQPSGRGLNPILKGIGFNYDFDDDEGLARDLRTGKPLRGKGEEIPILKENDILVTTGMDGVFPIGLKVATITKVELLKEGDYFYELEAKPLVHDLQQLDLVFVIPPLQQK